MDTVDVDDLVLSSVFKDYFQDSYQDNPEFLIYLSELSSYGIAKLNSEPQRLAEEKAQILEETRSLAFHNYKTFIQTAECCKEIFQDFQIIEKHVDSMLQRLPDLMVSCRNFLKQAQDINSSRKVNNLTLTKYAQLLEFLELPQLVDTCVRNEYYEETLELAEHVKRLEKKHSNIPIIQKIVDEVKLNMQQMLTQLLQQLRSNIQLPACLRILGYLRRMNIFTETQLRIKFLQTRDSWFQSVLNAIPKDDAYHHISKIIEASRVHLFDIITQYRAIFSDDDSLYSPSSFLKDHHHHHHNVIGRQVNDAVLFHSWVLQKISNFLFTLEDDLCRGGCGNSTASRSSSGNSGSHSGSSNYNSSTLIGRLDSLLAQCMYFGLSFSRVGVDFRGLVVPIFERASFGLFENAIQAAVHGLNNNLQSYSLLGSQPNASTTSTFHHLPSSSSTPSIPHPPPRLLQHLPLANFTNDILVAFNDLRLCAPYTLVCATTNCLNSALIRAVDGLVAFHKMDETTFTKQEMDRFVDMCCCFVDDLIPHINKCLQHLFNPVQVNALLGIQIAENVAKEEGLAELDVDRITDPLKRFLPQPQVILPSITTIINHVAETTTSSAINTLEAIDTSQISSTATAMITSTTTITSAAPSTNIRPVTSAETHTTPTTEVPIMTIAFTTIATTAATTVAVTTTTTTNESDVLKNKNQDQVSTKELKYDEAEKVDEEGNDNDGVEVDLTEKHMQLSEDLHANINLINGNINVTNSTNNNNINNNSSSGEEDDVTELAKLEHGSNIKVDKIEINNWINNNNNNNDNNNNNITNNNDLVNDKID